MTVGLALRGVSAGYGRLTVLRAIDLVVAEASLVAIIGPNGAGKSTLLKSVSGLIRPASGEIEAFGRRIDGLAPAAIVGLGISHVPERRQIFAELSVDDNLRLGAYPSRLTRAGVARRIDQTLELFPALGDRLGHDAAALSGGQQQMLAIARGLMSRPRLLMLDEPSLGLAPAFVRDIFAALGRLRDAGLSILLVEQNARGSLAIADRAYVLETGRVALEGTGPELLASSAVVERYLGVGAAVPGAAEVATRSPLTERLAAILRAAEGQAGEENSTG